VNTVACNLWRVTLHFSSCVLYCVQHSLAVQRQLVEQKVDAAATHLAAIARLYTWQCFKVFKHCQFEQRLSVYTHDLAVVRLLQQLLTVPVLLRFLLTIVLK
jgi:uncharacterized membrane protein (UPF0182 family)